MTDTVADVLLARLPAWNVEQVSVVPADGVDGMSLSTAREQRIVR